MGSRAAAGGGPGGDGAIPTARAEAAYLVTGAGAIALALGVAVRVATSAVSGEGFFALGAFAGAVMVAGSVALGWPGLAHWGVGLVGGAYVASVVVVGGDPDAWSPVIAVALLASSELAGWSIDSRRRGRDDLRAHWIRLRTVGVIAAAALVLALLTHGAGSVGVGSDVLPALAVAALLASVASLCALMLAFRRNS